MSPTSYQLLHPAIYTHPKADGKYKANSILPKHGETNKLPVLRIVSKKEQITENHRAGFVNIIGSPNVGKSTLMNKLVGEQLSIINKKAQTTRHRIMGIVNTPEWQIVYSDTPGVLDPAYKLQEGMMRFVRSALQDADVLLVVTDAKEDGLAHEETWEKIAEWTSQRSC